MSDDEAESSIYKRVVCVCCERWGDMLRVDSNNRICDVCNKGPICFCCYSRRGDWLDFFVCEDCANAAPLNELGGLEIDKTKYKPRFFKPNIRPTCDFCEEEYAQFCCLQCQQKICDKCFSTCEKCGDRFCEFCEEWSDAVCARCGDPKFIDPVTGIEKGDWGKTFRTWDQCRFTGDFGSLALEIPENL